MSDLPHAIYPSRSRARRIERAAACYCCGAPLLPGAVALGQCGPCAREVDALSARQPRCECGILSPFSLPCSRCQENPR